MKKHVRRGLCARCRRPAVVEVVYQRRSHGGVPGDPVAERYCHRHRPAGTDVLAMQVRTLDVASQVVDGHRGNGAGHRTRFIGGRIPRAPASPLDERDSDTLHQD